MDKMSILYLYFISVALVTLSQAALLGTGLGAQVGRGSATFDVNAQQLLGGKSLSRVVACDRVNLLITTDGFLYISGGFGGTSLKQTNFTPPELSGRIVVDGHCSFWDTAGTTVFIISTDDYRLFTFTSNGFNVVNSTFAVWVGTVTELTLDATAAGYPIKKVTTGGNALSIVFENGKTILYGNNAYGKLGQPSSTTTVTSTSPIVVPALSGGGNELFTDVSLGKSHTLLCGFSGAVYAAGLNDNGQLLDGTTVSSQTFIGWTFGVSTTRCVAVFATNYNSFVLTTAGRVIAVGISSAGQLGRGIFSPSTTPLAANILPTIRVNSLAVSAVDNDAYVLALAYNSTANRRILMGWGANQASSMAGFSGVPTAAPRELTYVANDLHNRVPISISAASQHTNVQTDSGYLTWTSTSNADNGAGVFGLSVYDEPVDIRNRIPLNDNFTMIKTAATSDPATYGVLANNILMRWGRGYSDPIILTYPIQARIVDIAVGRSFVVLLNELGEAWTHGTNSFGELGNSSVPNGGSTELRVIRVGNLQSNVISVAATESNGFAVKNDGSLWFWGTLPAGSWADYGADFSSTVAIPFNLTNTFSGGPIPRFKAVFTGPAANSFQSTVFLLDTAGVLYSFGANEYGQLCRGILPSQSSFVGTAGVVSLPAGEVVSSVTFAYGMSSVLTRSGNLYACGFDGYSMFHANNEFLYYGNFNDSFSVTSLTQLTILPNYNYPSPRPFMIVSHLVGSIMAVTQDNVLVTCYRNATCTPRSDDGIISTRRISVVSAFGYGSFVAAGPLEPVSYADVVPSTAQFIRIQGRGFPSIYGRNVLPSDRLELRLSEGSCTVFTAGADYTINGSTPFLLCKVDSGVTFTLGSLLTGVLSVRGDVSDPFVIGRVVSAPQVLGNTNTQYMASGGFRVLEIQGASFGTVAEHVQVKVVLSEFNSPPVACNVVYVEDTLVKCEISVGQNLYGLIYVQVSRLFATSSDVPAAWGQLMQPWQLYRLNSVIIPGNAKSIVALGNGFSGVNTSTTVQYRLALANGTTSAFTDCMDVSIGTSAYQDAISCTLPTGMLAQSINATFSMQVTRAGMTMETFVGTVGPELYIGSRPSSAKVARSAGYYLLPSPVTQDYFLKNFGDSLLSAITANVYVTSAKRSVNANETTSVNCTATRFQGDFLVCTVDRGTSGSVENPTLAYGMAWANIDVRGYSLSFQIFLGAVTDDPSVTPSVGNKVAMASGTEVTIQGTSFASGNFSTTDNTIQMTYRYTYNNNGVTSSGDTTIGCNILEASDSFIVCNASGQIYSTTGTTLSAVVTSWGSASTSTVIGTLVPPPTINIWRERVNITDPKININGTGFADTPTDNRVRIPKDSVPRDHTTCPQER
eukprot:TRINITY_DN3780_c0_g1_i1.p1 TRINITY_DN3780_c0_g1~~TRINITY_DN3780_c0_g1_i1.p1  ORF type:complete len:1395 (-),score=225.66 TRINITY_DN3780_c0_g1_i1:78-4193(-)